MTQTHTQCIAYSTCSIHPHLSTRETTWSFNIPKTPVYFSISPAIFKYPRARFWKEGKICSNACSCFISHLICLTQNEPFRVKDIEIFTEDRTFLLSLCIIVTDLWAMA